jgi:hypothetical protein
MDQRDLIGKMPYRPQPLLSMSWCGRADGWLNIPFSPQRLLHGAVWGTCPRRAEKNANIRIDGSAAVRHEIALRWVNKWTVMNLWAPLAIWNAVYSNEIVHHPPFFLHVFFTSVLLSMVLKYFRSSNHGKARKLLNRTLGNIEKLFFAASWIQKLSLRFQLVFDFMLSMWNMGF